MIERFARRLLVGVLILPATVAAQDWSCEPGDREVRHLNFSGNTIFTDALLRSGLVTEPSTRLRRWFRVKYLGARRCLDEAEFPRDVGRLQLLYYKSGYRNAQVDTTVEPLSRGAVSITFTIREGPPTLVDSITIRGLDSVPERVAVQDNLQMRPGEPFNLFALEATVDTLKRRLRNRGYPTADVFRDVQTDTARRRTVIALDVEPGTRARLGEIDVDVQPRAGDRQRIADSTVLYLLNVHSGDLFSETELERAKRNLYLTDAYRAVSVDLDSVDAVPPGDSLVKIHVRLAEGPMHSFHPSGGWGTLDCFRAEGEYHNNNLWGSARRLEVRSRLSKIGMGEPLGGADAFCYTGLREDPYSAKLNYHFGLTLREPRERAFGLRPTVAVYTERRSEYKAYLRSIPIGALLTATREGANRRTQSIGYQLDLGRTEAQPAVFCALQSVCLPEDRAPLLSLRRTAVASWSIRQDWSNDAQYPSKGGVGRLELRHASSAIGSDPEIQFSKATSDAAMYFAVGRRSVLAVRLQGSFVVGPSFTGRSKFIPPQERAFAGGSNTVRGFGQNELGPKVYILSAFDTVRVSADTVFFRAPAGIAPERSVPTGGSALVLGMLELRMPSPVLSNLMQLVWFVDAGELWTPSAAQAQDRFQSLKVTPGFGFRITTPVGPLRLDLAYNSYPRRTGAAFYDAPIELGGQLFCVSPGNELPVTGVGVAGGTLAQASGPCTANYRPPSPRGFLRRLTLQFGIGQTF